MSTCPDCLTHYPLGTEACPKDGHVLSETGDPLLEHGTQVGEYRVESLVGVGGFGRVYRAVHPVIGKTVAVKVLSRRFSSDETIVERFIAEARAVNVIGHPNIIDIFAFGALPDGRQFYVMEFLQGSTLEEHLADDRALDIDEGLAILDGVAQALSAAHEASIAHRDLKPENVFLVRERDGFTQVKLLDFGIAKLLGEVARSKTGAGSPLGTPDYMSPEQCRGRDVDHRTDIYAFGLLAFRVLTGRVPFEGEAAIDVLFMQVNTAPPRMSELNPAVPQALDDAVMHMLAKDPEQRPESIAAAMKELTEAASRIGASASFKLDATAPTRKRTRPSGGTTTTSPNSLGTRSGATTRPNGKRAWGVKGAVVLGLLVVAIFAARAVLRPNVVAAAAASPPPIVAVAPQAHEAPAATVTPKTTVDITVHSQPEGCEVFLGDEKLGVTPGPFALPRSEVALELSVRAAGYKSKTINVVPASDVSSDVSLTPVTKVLSAAARPQPVKKKASEDLERPF